MTEGDVGMSTVGRGLGLVAIFSLALGGCSSGPTETEPPLSTSIDATTPAPEPPAPSPTEEPSAEPPATPTDEATAEETTTQEPVFYDAAFDEMWEFVDDPIGLCKLWRDGDVYERLESMGADRAAIDEYFTEQCANVGDGSRAAPFNIDTPLSGIGGWSLQITDVELDAWSVVSAENQFNDPPADGYQYALFTVEATYDGDAEPVDPYWTFDFAIVGSRGNTFDDGCGVIPSPLRDVGDMYAGATGSGNVCIAVEADQIEGGALRVSAGFRDEGVFLLLPSPN